MTNEALRASVIVPVHNEAKRGFAVLDVLADAAIRLNFLIVVVCNGCTDDSAAIARARPGLRVIELPIASKTAALNAGDLEAGTVFPRLYLDADVATTADGLQALAAALQDGPASVAGPLVRYDTSGTRWLVRTYFSALETLPFIRAIREQHLEGRGLYGTNQDGRRRFAEFPPV